MSTTVKRWSAQEILQRASELQIEVSLADGNIQLNATPGVITEKISSIFREYKQEIIDYLHSQYHSQFLAAPTMCAVCGINMELLGEDAGEEDLQFYYDGEGRCFCEEHWKGPLPDTQVRYQGKIVPVSQVSAEDLTKDHLLQRARQLADAWPGGCAISPVSPRTTLKEHMALQRVVQHSLKYRQQTMM